MKKGVQEKVVFIQVQQEDDEKILGILQLSENLAVVCQSINIQIWDLYAQRRLKSVIAHNDFIQKCVKLTTSEFATVSQDGNIAIWSIKDGNNIELLTKLQQPNNQGLALCKFGESMLIAGYSKGMVLWK